MLTLIFPKTNLTSASIPVRWCLDADALDTATATGLKPFVLIQIDYHSGHPSSFKIYPLDQFSAYLDVHYPGQVDIQAFLVTATQNSKDAIRKVLMCNSYDRETVYAFTQYTTQFHTKNFSKTYDINIFDASDEHSFEIDPSFFGKELPEWAKFFVNRYWYQDKPIDECAQRRRILLFPITTLWLVLIEGTARWLWNFFGCLWFWSILVGARPGHLLHPFDDMMIKYDVNHMPKLYDWFTKSKYKDSIIMVVGLTPFIPIVYIITVWLAWLSGYSILESLYAGPAWMYIIAGCIAIVVGVVWFGIYKPFNALKRHIPSIVSDWADNLSKLFWVTLDKFLDWLERIQASSVRERELLLCHEEHGECLPELTFKDKPVKLIFADIKNKVCRPMRG